MQFTRRDFIKASAATLLVPSRNIISIQECVDLPPSPFFPLGVASGDVTPERAIITTRFARKERLKLAVWEADAQPSSPIYTWEEALVRDGGFIHIDALQLKPYTNYRYAFVVMDAYDRADARSRIGRFKTAPGEAAVVPLTVGAVSCTDNRYEPVLLEHAALRSDIDVFLHLGDMSYNDGCETLKEFRAQWAKNLSKRGYLDLRKSTSLIATLDDHEISDNFDPGTVDKNVYNAALRAFFDNTPTRCTGDNRIWRSFKWGRTCEIFVLDCRTERRHPRYISRTQMEWLKNGLLYSNAIFKVIMNSVPITEFPFTYTSDRWEGYPAQRTEILSFIDDNLISGVVWLSGDFHFASVGRVSLEGVGSTQTEILAGPGAQFPNFIGQSLKGQAQFDWVSTRNNYATLTFDPFKNHIKLCYFGGAEDPSQTCMNPIDKIYEQFLYPSPSEALNKKIYF